MEKGALHETKGKRESLNLQPLVSPLWPQGFAKVQNLLGLDFGGFFWKSMLIRRLTQPRISYLADYDEVLTFKCPLTAPTGAAVERWSLERFVFG